MADSPIRIAVELEGIESNARLDAAIMELQAAAAELLEESADVTGFGGALGGEIETVKSQVWTDMRPHVKSWSFGVERAFKIEIKGVTD